MCILVLVAIVGVDPLDPFAGKMMSKHCAQLVHDSGGVYGLTERAQADRGRREEALQAIIQQKSKRIRTLITSADNLRIARDKWKLVLLHQKAAGKALVVAATDRLRTKLASRNDDYKALLRAAGRVKARGLWDARRPLMHSIPYALRKKIAADHVNSRIAEG